MLYDFRILLSLFIIADAKPLLRFCVFHALPIFYDNTSQIYKLVKLFILQLYYHIISCSPYIYCFCVLRIYL